MADLYLDLTGARERLCRAQVSMHPQHRPEVQAALDTIDRLGVFYAPQQWSRHDMPPMPDPPESVGGDE